MLQPPIPKHNWSDVFDATKDGNICTQPNWERRTVIGSEDCLVINVYTPRVRISKKHKVMVKYKRRVSNIKFFKILFNINKFSLTLKKSKVLLPVMVWIHGGGFIFGSSQFSEANPELLLEKDIVFVSFNYRLGIFGRLAQV